MANKMKEITQKKSDKFYILFITFLFLYGIINKEKSEFAKRELQNGNHSI